MRLSYIINIYTFCWVSSGTVVVAGAGAGADRGDGTGAGVGVRATEDGKSWTNDFILGVIANVNSSQACANICKNTKGCSAFTWFGSAYDCNDFAESCKLYSAIGKTKTCTNCTSGLVAGSNLCRRPSQCTVGENLLSAVKSATEIGCRDVCKDTPSCSFYTWYGDSLVFNNVCFLLSSCVESTPCTGCYSGPPTCRPTHCEGIEHHNMDDPSRNVNAGKSIPINY